LSSVFYFNKEPAASSSCKVLKKDVSFEYRIVREDSSIKVLGQQAWRICFSVFLADAIDANTIIMCKIRAKDRETVVFDANVIYPGHKTAKGYKTSLGVLTISSGDKDRLEREFLR
jgi:hypothetical protein